MSLVRWNPFRELEDMQSRLTRLFGDVPVPRMGDDGMSLSGWSPAVDVQETDQEYLSKPTFRTSRRKTSRWSSSTGP